MNEPSRAEFSTRFSATEWAGRKPAYASGGPITIPAEAPTTLTEALRRRSEQGDRGVTYIQKEGQEDTQSYAELWREARAILAGLRKLGLKPGDRVILQIDSLRNHFTTFWACVLGGFTPVTVAVAASYGDKNGVVSKLWNTWKLLKGPLIITSGHLEKAIQGLSGFIEMPGLRTTAVEPLKANQPTEEIHESMPEDLVFFQLTSGSTGVPKCIQETHRGIIHHIHGAQQFNRYKAENVTLNWLPVDHVVPILTSHLKDVYVGCAQIHVKSDVVLSDPLQWLDLMEKYGVTHTWCPNFGFKLVSDRLAALNEINGRERRKWDLSRVEFMMNAGEQVTLPVVKDFLERTAKFGIRPAAMQPAFGMAEVCTCMTYQNEFSVETGVYRFKKSTLGGLMEFAQKDDPAAVTFVDLGPVVPGVEIRITDNKNKVVPEGVVGRFQIRGAVVTPGYLYNEVANAEAFVGEGWFNSGDLGFILNGRLTLTGREKEMIIVRGVNFYCYEIEDVVNGIEGVEPTFVSSSAVPDAETGTEGLAVMFVAKAVKSDEELVTLTKEIRAKVATTLGISPAFVIPLEKSAFLKTTSGKIQRGQMKKNFESGEYAAILQRLKAAGKTGGQEEAKDDVEGKLVEIWRELLKSEEIGLQDNFFAAGGDSLLAARVISRVQDVFQVELPLHVLFNGGGTVAGMAEHIRKRESTRMAVPPVKPRAESNWAPASLGQQRLWLLDQMNPGSPAYNVGTITRLNGAVEPAILEGAIASLMEHHETLRSRFEVTGGQLCQFFDVAPISVAREDLAAGDFAEVYRVAYEEAAKPFDLRMGPLIRARLFTTGANGSFLALTLHQTVIDGWSLKILFKQLADLYEQHGAGKKVGLEPLPVQYGDYAAWQREWLKDEVLEAQMNYWRKELAGELPEIDLPIDLARPAVQSHLGATQVHYLPTDLSEALRGFAKEQGATVFMAIIAAYQAFLSRVSEQDEVVIGTAMAGRGKSELENLIGFFVSTVAMRASFLPNPSFAKLLAQTRDKTVAAYQHQYAPFEKIVEEIQPARAGKRTPIFQVWFGAWDALPEHRAGAVTMTPMKVFMPGAQFELSLFAIDRKEIELIWEYRTDLFLPKTIGRFREQFEKLLRQMLRNPEAPLQTVFAALNDEDYQERIREQSRMRDGLKTARRKGMQMPS